MTETLDTLAEKIVALTAAMDNGFGAVDKRFEAVDTRFDELKSQLRTQIDAVDAKVGLVLEKMTNLTLRDARHSAVHVRYERVLDNHELRLRALESKDRPREE